MKAGIARHPAEREVHLSVCQRASGSWYAGFSVALDQGIVGETQLFHRQANRPRVQAVKPYHTIPMGREGGGVIIGNYFYSLFTCF